MQWKWQVVWCGCGEKLGNGIALKKWPVNHRVMRHLPVTKWRDPSLDVFIHAVSSLTRPDDLKDAHRFQERHCFQRMAARFSRKSARHLHSLPIIDAWG